MDYQGSSRIINDHQGLSVIINDYQGLSVIINDHQGLSMIIKDHQGLLINSGSHNRLIIPSLYFVCASDRVAIHLADFVNMFRSQLFCICVAKIERWIDQ